MTMIRNVMFGISLLALSGASAFAAPVKHVSKPRVVAQADTAAPAADKAAPAKKEKKHVKKTKGDAAKTDGAKEMKAAPTPAPTPDKANN
jgi:hypothetical protein